jgi:hypothetical protein
MGLEYLIGGGIIGLLAAYLLYVPVHVQKF